MPKVTVVPEDKLIIVDGEPIVFDSPFPAPSSLHALQWNGVGGHIEWTDDDNWTLEAEAYEEEVANCQTKVDTKNTPSSFIFSTVVL